MKAILPILLLLTLCASCVTPPQPFRTAFNEQDFEPFKGAGTSTITGQAFLKTRGGDVKFGAGNQITLLPLTPYTAELRERATINGERLQAEDARLNKHRRTTVADGTGNFEFKNLPTGEYLLSCTITWEIPSRYGATTTGGIAYGSAKVGPGETTKTILTQ